MTTTTGQDVISVPAAQARYLGGMMSLRWRYKQIELGRPPHGSAGSAVLLRVTDVEAFVAERCPPALDDPEFLPGQVVVLEDEVSSAIQAERLHGPKATGGGP